MNPSVLPGRCPAVQEILKQLPIPHRVHRLPEAAVPICQELAVLGEPLHRFFLKDRVVSFEVLKHARLKDKEAAVDPAFARLGLLGKPAHLVAVEFQAAEARRRMDRGDRCQLAMAAMKRD